MPAKTVNTPERDTREFPDVMDAETRRRYDEAPVFDEQTNSLIEEAARSERLTKDDFAIRINTK